MPLTSGKTYIHHDVISPFSSIAAAPTRFGRYSFATSNPASTAVGNSQIYMYYFSIYAPFQVSYAWILKGATINGAFDIGIYDSSGNVIQSTGQTNQSAGGSDFQTVALSRLLMPGKYSLAFGSTSATQTLFAFTGGNVNVSALFTQGFCSTASGTPCPLPSTITPDAAFNGASFPLFGLCTSRGM